MDSNTPVPDHSRVQVGTYDRPAAPVTPAPKGSKKSRRRGRRIFTWLIGIVLGIVVLGLLACALVGGLVAGIALKLANQVTISENSVQTFTVSGAPSLDIHNPSGSVRVQSGEVNTIEVAVTKIARDSSTSAARDDLAKIAVQTAQTGDQLAISVDFGDHAFFGSSHTVDLVITVPPQASVSANVTEGDVRIDGVTGPLVVSGGATSVTLQNVELADGSRVRVASGSVNIQGTVPDNATIDITVSTGNVSLRLPIDVQARLDARTDVGNIHITGWPLQATPLNHVGAQVDGALGPQPTATLHVRVDTGDIAVSQG
jgi:hypothetical protein